MIDLENTELQEEIEEAVAEKRFSRLRQIFLTMEPADIALILADLPEEQLPVLFRLLPKELAAEVFAEFEPDAQELLITGFSNRELKAVLDEMFLDDTVDLVEEMPATIVKRILRQSDPEMRQSINEMLKYPEDSAGSIMTTEYVDLKADMTVAEAIRRIRRTAPDKETINICYVTDASRKLIGTVSIRALLLAEEEDKIKNIMDPNVVSVSTLEDRELVAQAFNRYGFIAIPVVDGENRLVGIVTFDDAIIVMEEEVTEDIEKMAAITPTDKPYLRAGALETWKARIPWLLLLMLSATFTSMIISYYEAALAACIILNSYIPMLTGTGGNSGTQASVAVIRALSLGEVEFADLCQVAWKEIRVSILCGGVLAGANFVKMLLFDRMLMDNPAVTVSVAAVVSVTLVLVVFIAKVVGSILPLLAKKLKFDPAVMASPFITTIVDALSLLVYFQFAKMFLGI